MTDLQLDILPYRLHFKQPAGTSRGVLTTRKVWYVRATRPDGNARPGEAELLDLLRSPHGQADCGWGECAPLPGLSCDDVPDYEETLRHACRLTEADGQLPDDLLRDYPSIRFGLETALRNLRAGGEWRLWNSPFVRGEEGIVTNGLIWMGTFDEMYARIEEKMRTGFRCIKLKIGAIDFERELALLDFIRRHFSPDEIELRVDANGAFTPADAPEKLERLAAFTLHSIEQPIRAGQWDEMARLCRTSPLPIALDEELIGVNDPRRKAELLDRIRPAYLILKPSLHGGLAGAEEWMRLAAERGIRYWVTSALESNVGLNAIAQWCATQHPTMPQGLGTGLLFTDNIDSPLTMKGEKLWFNR